MSANTSSIKCPACGAPMVLRNGKLGKFYGCSNYPKCTRTIDIRDQTALVQAQSAKTRKKFEPSKYQQAIFDFVSNAGAGNATVEAVAGSGKTTTIEKAVNFVPKTRKTLFCAFNKHIRDELANRLSNLVSVRTCHSLGLSALAESITDHPSMDDWVDANKMWDIAKELLPSDEMGPYRAALVKLVGLAKYTLADFEDKTALRTMADYYGVDMYGHDDMIINNVLPALQKGFERLSVIDYEDMIWLPLAMDLPVEQFDMVFADERQDFNAAQVELLSRSVRSGGRIVAVGDEKQAIYGFMGADPSALSKIKATFNTVELPLSICYRCPVSHLNLAKEIVPQIEPAPNAEMGTVVHTNYTRALMEMRDGDLVMCRVNAPLVSAAYNLIKRGLKAVIRGRDFGKGLIAFIDGFHADSIIELTRLIYEYRDREVARLEAANKMSQVQNIQDKCETIFALCEGMIDVFALKARIKSLFDDESKSGVVFSSVHRAKGDEANRVWILKPELIPHPKASQPWEVQQEMNLKYVSLTRSKRDLIFVSES